MALAYTFRKNTSGPSALTTTSFTPSNNSLLVAIVGFNKAGGTVGSTIISGGGLTWTRQAFAGGVGAFENYVAIYTAPVTTGASMTVTATYANVDDDIALSVVEFTGYNTGSPIGLSHTGSAATSRSGAYSGSLGGTTAASSIVVGAGHEDGGTTTIGASWTNIANGSINFTKYVHEYRAGALTTVDFAALTTSFSWAVAAVEIKAAAGGGGPTPLDAAGGSFAVTGTTASLERNRKVDAGAGSFAVTGTAATTKVGLKVAAGAGSYAVTGTDAALAITARKVIAAAGSFAATGSDAGLSITAKKLAAGAGSYAVTGSDATLKKGQTLPAEAGSYAVTGSDVTLKVTRKVDAGAGSYAVTGTAASLEVGRKAAAGAGSYAVTGTDAGLSITEKVLAAGAGSYAVTGTDAGLAITARKLAAGAGSYAVTGSDATLTKTAANTLAADAGAYAVSGQDVALKVGRKLAAGAGSYAITGSDVTLKKGISIILATGGYDVSGQAVTLKRAIVLPIGSGSYTVAGSDATLDYSGATPPPTPTPTPSASGGGYVSTNFYSKPTPEWLVIWQRIQWLLKGLDGDMERRVEEALRAAFEGFAPYPESAVNLAALALLDAVRERKRKGRPIPINEDAARAKLSALLAAFADEDADEADVAQLLTAHRAKQAQAYEGIKALYASLEGQRAALAAEIKELEDPDPEERVAAKIQELETTIASAAALLAELRNHQE